MLKKYMIVFHEDDSADCAIEDDEAGMSYDVDC
jgi:hypothetical protein